MRMLLDAECDHSVGNMLHRLRWLNATNMRVWCCIRTLKRIMSNPLQVPHLWEVVNLNQGPMHSVRYNALKLHWKKNTRWARDSFVYQATDYYNKLGLHSRGFEDYQDMRNQVKLTIRQMYGNRNFK